MAILEVPLWLYNWELIRKTKRDPSIAVWGPSERSQPWVNTVFAYWPPCHITTQILGIMELYNMAHSKDVWQEHNIRKEEFIVKPRFKFLKQSFRYWWYTVILHSKWYLVLWNSDGMDTSLVFFIHCPWRH